MQSILLFLKGIAIGVANIIPGVSGATLAVIFKVYDKLLNSINTLFSDMKNSLKFLIPFGLGMAIGIVALGSAMDFFLTRFSLQATAFIAGLMAGSIPFIHKMAAKDNTKKTMYYTIAVVAAIIIISLSLFSPATEIYTGYGGINTALAIRLFLGGFLGAAAMIIPGMSGSIILILLGVFPLAMNTITLIREYMITPFDFGLLPPILIVVIPVGIGMLVGVLATSRIVAFLLEKHQAVTYSAIMGLIFGTIFAIFNNDATYISHRQLTPVVVITAVATFLIGAMVSLKLGKKE